MLLLALALSARAEPLPLDTVCAWDDTRWDHYTKLYVQGTGTAFATSRGWAQAAFTGDLGFDVWGWPRLRGSLTGEGVTVYADVDVNEDGVFELSGETVKMGALTVVEGGKLSILGRSSQGVLVGPGQWTLDEVAPRLAPYAELGCERISLWASLSKDDAELLSAAGLPRSRALQAIRGNRRVQLRDAPAGHVVGHIKKQRWERVVHVIDDRDGWTWVAIPSWQGAVWSGWIEANLVEPEGGGGGLGMIGAGAPQTYEVRRCAGEQPLFAGGGRPVEVGKVAAGTPFRVLGARGDHVSIVFLPDAWLDPIEGGELLLPASAGSCPAEAYTREPAPLEGVIDPG